MVKGRRKSVRKSLAAQSDESRIINALPEA